jgi:hypothetical protein
MKIPNSDRAVIESSKLTDYLLNPEHKRGGAKARIAQSIWIFSRKLATIRNRYS